MSHTVKLIKPRTSALHDTNIDKDSNMVLVVTLHCTAEWDVHTVIHYLLHCT